mgnify:CR=1 FL=1
MAHGWDAFIHWARRLSESYDLDTSERSYKLALAALLGDNEARVLRLRHLA